MKRKLWAAIKLAVFVAAGALFVYHYAAMRRQTWNTLIDDAVRDWKEYRK